MSEFADQAIRVLNEALELDPIAINQIFGAYVYVNEALADHPTIQVGRLNDGKQNSLRFLGLINGICGADIDDWGFVCVHYDESNRIIRFGRTPGK